MKIHHLGQAPMEAFQGNLQAPVADGSRDDFAQQLMDVLREVNSAQQDSAQMQTDLMTGQPVEFHDVMIAMERASVAMNLTLQVRNKMLEAYQEVMRTQI